jgi:RHS repeat-associated protein
VRNWIHATGTPDYQYDAAGNMTFNATAPTQNYSYDQENRLTRAAGYTYTYDADGNRVKKANGSTGTLYWYMSPGIVAESDLNGNLTSEYVFFNGERVARKDFAGGTTSVAYYFSDHLKTASVITDAAGTITADSDYYPWGGGELQFVANDSNHYKFTGKERDTETNLDYFGARYYSNGLGRWVSADWSATPVPVPYADLGDPQSLNLYGYVRALPTTRLDINGHDPQQRERPPAEEEAQREAEERAAKENDPASKEPADPLERARDELQQENAQARAGARELIDRIERHDLAGMQDEDGVCHVQPLNSETSIGNANAKSEPPTLPPRSPGDKTSGILNTPKGTMLLKSGVAGPAKLMPKGSPGFDIVTRTHVEGHAAAVMNQLGLKSATLVINNSQICSSCAELLPKMIPSGSQLTVVTSDGVASTFTGVPK